MTYIDYHQLKMSKYGLPAWDGLIAPAIEIGLQKEDWHIKELKTAVADALNLPDKLRNLTYEKFPDTSIIVDRVGWALSEGANSGVFIRPRRGIYRVTELGKHLFEQYGYQLDGKIIHSQPQYVAHQKEVKERKEAKKN